MIVPFKTEKAEGCFARVPDDATDFFINKVGCIRYTHNKGREGTAIEPAELGFYAHPDNYKILGLTSELTEEQWREVVDEVIIRCEVPVRHSGYLDLWRFRDYTSEDQFKKHSDTATESGKSLMQSLRCYEVNPLGVKPHPSDYPMFKEGGGNIIEDTNWKDYENDLKQWQEAQDRTGKWLLILKQSKQ